MLCEKGKYCGIGLDEIKDFKIMILLVDDSGSKAPTCNAGDTGDLGSIPGLGSSFRGGNSNPLQYSCLENPMDRKAWQARAHKVAKSQT